MKLNLVERLGYKRRNLWLRRNFRNGAQLVDSLCGGPRASEAVLRDGTRIIHPEGASGFMEALVEVWYQRAYLPRGFWSPEPGATAVDVGANIGLFAIQICKLFPQVKVIALEPFEENFKCLLKNLEAAEGQRAKAYQLALGGTAGEGQMVRKGMRSLDHVLEPAAKLGPTVENGVSVVTFEKLLELAGADRISLLKVDIEGSEYIAFEAASDESLLRCDAIAVEYHDHIREGCSRLIQRRLSPSHDIKIRPSGMPGCGLMFAKRKYAR